VPGKFIIIIAILFIVAGCVSIGGHKWNPTFSIMKMLDNKGNKNQPLGTRG